MVQDVPSYSSDTALAIHSPQFPVVPPKLKAAVCDPQPPRAHLAVFKGCTFVQDVPSYSSVTTVGG